MRHAVVGIGCALAAAVGLPSCAAPPATQAPGEATMTNPVGYFEIPVSDMDRAVRFYEAVFDITLQRETIDGYDMALFPHVPGGAGATGALAKGDVYVPAKAGPILYFATPDIATTLARATAAGGRTLYPRKAVGALGFVAEFEDSEGNRIALSEPPG